MWETFSYYLFSFHKVFLVVSNTLIKASSFCPFCLRDAELYNKISLIFSYLRITIKTREQPPKRKTGEATLFLSKLREGERVKWEMAV